MKFHSLALCSVFVAGFLQTTSAYSQAFLNRAEVGRSVEQTANTGNTTGSGVTIENSTGNGQSNGLSGFRTGSGGTNNSTEESQPYIETPPPALGGSLSTNHPGGNVIFGGGGEGAGGAPAGGAAQPQLSTKQQLRVTASTNGHRPADRARGLRNFMASE